MPFTEDDYLPTYDELKTQELNISSAPMRAGAHHFGKYCDNQCKEYMLCSKEERDPRKCVKEGKDVTSCGVEFFQKVKQSCAFDFTQYWKCVDHSDYDMSFKRCRKLQSNFDKCVLDKLGQERPVNGHFSKIRIHDTSRPKPIQHVELPPYDPRMTQKIDPNTPMPKSSKTGERLM